MSVFLDFIPEHVPTATKILNQELCKNCYNMPITSKLGNQIRMNKKCISRLRTCQFTKGSISITVKFGLKSNVYLHYIAYCFGLQTKKLLPMSILYYPGKNRIFEMFVPFSLKVSGQRLQMADKLLNDCIK